MTEIYRFSESEFLAFGLVLIRLSSFVVSWPVFGVENVSTHVKVLFALVLSLVIFPTLRFPPDLASSVGPDLAVLSIREAFVGLSLGYLARMFFFAFRVAGELVAQAMSLTSAQVFNPMLGGQSTPVEQFYVTFATLFYLGINGHHHLLRGVAASFEWVPPATYSLNVGQFSGLGHMVQEIVTLGLRFSAPVVISVLVVNLILGVVGRTVPQLNVLVTSFPINILVGFGLLIVTLPLLMDQMGEFMNLSLERVFEFVKTY